MRKSQFILLGLLLYGINAAHAQQSTVASGGTATGNGSATYSVGQVFDSHITTAGGQIGEGVQQPREFLIGVDEINGIAVTMNVFPNPASSFVNIKINSEKLKDVSFILCDVQGKLLQTNAITEELTSIPLEKYEPGNYIISVLNKKEKVNSFQITKTK